MSKLKYVGRLIIAIALCSIIWFTHPAKEQVEQLEGESSRQYMYANYLLKGTVQELLKWDYSQPLNDEDKDYLSQLLWELDNIHGIIFNGYVVHQDWLNRMHEIENYLSKYVHTETLLSKEEVEDLQQALNATLFITMDFIHMDDDLDFYDALHDDQTEMVERVKKRLATKY